MRNITINPTDCTMNHATRLSAFKQVSMFISSSDFYLFDITAHDLCVLFTICRYLDMPSGKCFAKQQLLAKESRMSIRQFKKSSQKLVQLNLILRTTGRVKSYNYYLGEYFDQLT